MRIFILILTSLFIAFILFIDRKYRNSFEDMLSPIETGNYPLYEIYYIGLGILDFFKYDINSKEAKKGIKKLEEIYGRQYATYYYYILLGSKITLISISIIGVLVFMNISANLNLGFYGIMIVALILWYTEESIKDKVNLRRDELIRTYPGMLSKLLLLVKSGMPIREAWESVALDNEGILYKEMKITVEELSNGMIEIEAYKAFGERCSIKQIKKFSSLMIQNLQKGSAEVADFLRDMSKEAWEEKKNFVKRKGETASAKLVFPIGLIFVGVLIIIIVPMFGALGL